MNSLGRKGTKSETENCMTFKTVELCRHLSLLKLKENGENMRKGQYLNIIVPKMICQILTYKMIWGNPYIKVKLITRLIHKLLSTVYWESIKFEL